MNRHLENKRALVTGGRRGIGAAIVGRLAGEGADVALTYVSRPDQAGELGGIDVLGMVAANLRGVFAATQAAVKHMKPGGRIVTIGSCNADRMPFGGWLGVRQEQGGARGLW